eukprot:Sspe_Gene.19787::Locus_7227_Transcript_1_1_Confidence_1.000_Length_7617::g.19787::m.19787/K07203/MTOR, FRAP, TOR; serine/threonine-protein kinase mTOR
MSAEDKDGWNERDTKKPPPEWVNAVTRACDRIKYGNADRAVRELRRLMEARVSELTPDNAVPYQRVVNKKLQDLAGFGGLALGEGEDRESRLGSIKAAAALVDVEYTDSGSRTEHRCFLANFLSKALDTSDHEVAELAASTLGRIVKAECLLENDIIETEAYRYIERLGGFRHGGPDRVYAAAAGIRELALASPDQMAPHLASFASLLHRTLGHPCAMTRRVIAKAVNALLAVKDITGSQVFEQLRDLSVGDLDRTNPAQRHGSLLVLRELTEYTDIMEKGHRLAEKAVEMVNSDRELVDVRLAAAELLRALMEKNPGWVDVPQALAACHNLSRADGGPEGFFIIATIVQEAQRDAAALAAVEANKDRVISQVQSALSSSVPSLAAAVCAAALLEAFPNDTEQLNAELLHSAASLPLNTTLTHALNRLITVMPDRRSSVLDTILRRAEFVIKTINVDSSLYLDALRALEDVDLTGLDPERIATFAESCLLRLLEYDEITVRSHAILVATKILATAAEGLGAEGVGLLVKDPDRFEGPVCYVLEEVLRVAVSDLDYDVRILAWRRVRDMAKHWKPVLNLPRAERYLYAAFADESPDVREIVLDIGAELESKGMQERMRVLKDQVQTELQCPIDVFQQQQAVHMLGHLAGVAPHLFREDGDDTDDLIDQLLERLSHATNARLKAAILYTLSVFLSSYLADLSTEKINDLVEFCASSIEEPSSRATEPAMLLLGLLIRKRGGAIQRASNPKVISRLQESLKEQHRGRRTEAIRLLGWIGALDPWTVRRRKHRQNNMFKASVSDVYTISALLEVLEHPSLALRRKAVHALQNILVYLRAKGHNSGALLSRLIPAVVSHICKDLVKDSVHTESLLKVLTAAVSLMKQGTAAPRNREEEDVLMQNLPDVTYAMQQLWGIDHPQMAGALITLAEELFVALGGKVLHPHARWLIPNLIQAARGTDRVLSLSAVDAFERMAPLVQDFLTPVTACLLDIAGATDQPPETRSRCLRTMCSLCRAGLDMRSVGSRIIIPLVKIAQGVVTPAASAQHCVWREARITLEIVGASIGEGFEMYRPMITRVLPPVPSLCDDDITSVPHDAQKRIMDIETRVLSVDLKRACTVCNTACLESEYERWLDNFAQALLNDSPRQLLKACADLCRAHPPLARKLFAPAFAYFHHHLKDEAEKAALIEAVVKVMQKSLDGKGGVQPPRTVIKPLLGLAAFLEKFCAQALAEAGERQKLVIFFLKPKSLSLLADKCQNYAQALFWLESHMVQLGHRFALQDWARLSTRSELIEACRMLVHVNRCLELPHQAEGVLIMIQGQDVVNSETTAETYEALGWWQRAAVRYFADLEAGVNRVESIAGIMRCREHLGDWYGVLALAKKYENDLEVKVRTARAVSHAAWNLADWETMAKSVSLMPKAGEGAPRHPGDSPPGCTAALYRAILDIREGKLKEALVHVSTCRSALEKELRAHVTEGYGRAYELLVMMQHLSEIEDIVEYKQVADKEWGATRQMEIRKVWSARLRAMRPAVWHMKDTLTLRTLAVPPHDALDDWLYFVDVLGQVETDEDIYKARATRTLRTLLGQGNCRFPQLTAAYRIRRWRGCEANLSHLGISQIVADTRANPRLVMAYMHCVWDMYQHEVKTSSVMKDRMYLCNALEQYGRELQRRMECTDLVVEVLLTLSHWKQELYPGKYWRSPYGEQILGHLHEAKELSPNDRHPWCEWAAMNLRISRSDIPLNMAIPFAEAAVDGFVRSIQLDEEITRYGDGPVKCSVVQDVLRLLRVIVIFGHTTVRTKIRRVFDQIPPGRWVEILPQLVARLDEPGITELIEEVLIKVAASFPQRVLLAVSVPLRDRRPMSQHGLRRRAVERIEELTRRNFPNLVEQVKMITDELVRISVLWAEEWDEAIEEAMQLKEWERSFSRFNDLLADVAKAETECEKQFSSLYLTHLLAAQKSWEMWRKTRASAERSNAINLLRIVQGDIRKKFKDVEQSGFTLSDVAPQLSKARSLEVAIPGQYQDRDGGKRAVIVIQSFSQFVNVLNSKRRPKQLALTGSDGKQYKYLLKGHEDLRLDQRVMQVLTLVNSLLFQHTINNPFNTNSHNQLLPAIETFAVVPIAPTAGLIGWVESAQTFTSIVKEMRGGDKKMARILEERNLWREFQCQNDHLTVMQKAEALEASLSRSSSDDIHLALWLRAVGPAEWVDRRTLFTRSLAIMSMVGYILGLGDRHPGNLMLDSEGKVVHIDFGDCFESAMYRELYPEKVPFRLTAMLVRAMGVGGLDGLFCKASYTTMAILRRGKHALMAMLEAFVYDPIMKEDLPTIRHIPCRQEDASSSVTMSMRQVLQSRMADDASGIIQRIQDKLEGTDFQHQFSDTRLTPAPEHVIRGFAESPAISPGSTDHPFTALLEGTSEDHPFTKLLGMRTPTQEFHARQSRRASLHSLGAVSPLDVADQVDRLVETARALDNLAQCYVGWCPFW